MQKVYLSTLLFLLNRKNALTAFIINFMITIKKNKILWKEKKIGIQFTK